MGGHVLVPVLMLSFVIMMITLLILMLLFLIEVKSFNRIYRILLHNRYKF